MNAEQSNTTAPTETTSLPVSNADAPRLGLLQRDPTTMSDEELMQFVLEVRAKRTSNQLAAELRPQRKAASAASTSKRAAALASLLADTDEEDAL